MDFGTLRVTYLGNAKPVLDAAAQVDRINRQTARNAEAQDRLVERSARQLAQVRTREAKRSADDFIRELNRMKQAERQSSGGGGGGLGSELSALTGGRLAFAGGGAIAAVGALTAGFAAAAKAGVEYKGSLDSLERSFKNLLGSQSAAQQHLEELRRFAAGTPFEFVEVARASQRFQAMGISARNVVPLLSDIAKAVATIGGGQDELDRVALAISQINAKGRVMSQEMNQLSEVGISGWKALQAETGKTREELMKMVEAGEVSAETFNTAFHRMYGDSNALAAQMGTLSGSTARLKDVSRQLLADAFTPLHSALKAITVELARVSTEGFNAQKGLEAAASVFRHGFNMANLGGGDKLLIALAMQQGGPQLAAAVQALLQGNQPKGGGNQTWGETPVNVPEALRYKSKISDADLVAIAKRETEQARLEAERKATQEAERQSNVIKRISDDYAVASTRVTGFTRDSLTLEAALYKLSIGFHTLSEANQETAKTQINHLFVAKAQLAQLEENKKLEDALTSSVEENAAALRGGKTALEEVNDLYLAWSQNTVKAVGWTAKLTPELDKLFDRARNLAKQKDFSDWLKTVADQMERIKIPDFQFPDYTLPGDRLGHEGPWVDPSSIGAAPPNAAAEALRRREQFREIAEDVADIYGRLFDDIGRGWDAMWHDMLDIARDTLRRVAQELLLTFLTGERSSAGGLVGTAANAITGLFNRSSPSAFPTAGASNMGGSYLQPSALPGYASGTPWARPGWSWVGERGPELVKFRGGESVMSNRDSMSEMRFIIVDDRQQALERKTARTTMLRLSRLRKTGKAVRV